MRFLARFSIKHVLVIVGLVATLGTAYAAVQLTLTSQVTILPKAQPNWFVAFTTAFNSTLRTQSLRCPSSSSSSFVESNSGPLTIPTGSSLGWEVSQASSNSTYVCIWNNSTLSHTPTIQASVPNGVSFLVPTSITAFSPNDVQPVVLTLKAGETASGAGTVTITIS